MTQAEKYIFVGVIGGCVGLSITFVIEDWRNRARGNERVTCPDEPDRKAYMARLPGEAHTVERCVKVIRYGDPAWIPYMSHPLKGRGE